MRIHFAAMRAAGRSLVAGLLFATSGLAFAASPDGVWQEIDESAIARNASARQIVPLDYRTVQLNRGSLERVLGAAPMERDVAVRDSTARLTLPMPDGLYTTFRVVESPIMEPELAARYPQIRTWVGEGIDDPTATVRFDLTHKGFHAQILSADGTTYVDPFQPGDVDNYISFRKQDYRRDQPLVCSSTGEAVERHAPDKHTPAGMSRPKVSSGANLRTYRLAMAATGEYSQALGGTVADGLAGIVTTMNRVNGIYERDLSVRMVLVANTDLVIFTDGGSDPYTNSSGSAMLGENLATLNSLIGTANYDVGHVVSTGGGGVAQLASVCGSGKARGVTGLPNPTTDAFDVDFVAHEIGHQFNGSHTFNGSDGNCSGGNRSGANAFETGSGVTIQAYAGICGADDLQPNSEDYFHRRSLNTMLSFTTDPTPGTGGGSCGVLTSTGNAIPVPTAPAAFTIPASTPFELNGSATDADDAAANLTYIWEQFDIGAVANSPGVLVDNGGPLFRSFAPRRDGSRTFPSLRYILNNGNVAPATAPIQGTVSPNFFSAELLPSTSRTMNFRLTVRDNRAAGGGTNEVNTAVTVVGTTGPFTVTAPNTAVTWAAGTNENVTWNVASTDVAPILAANVRILLSLDGGFTWPVVLAASEPNDGSATVAIPADVPASTQARVRVEAIGNIFFDVSNVNFTVTGTNTPPTISGIVIPVLTTRQGSPTATANIATISDSADAAADLTVAVTGAPPELDVSVLNTAGTVSLSATASCTLVAIGAGNKSYPLRLEVTDTDDAMSSAEIVVRVGANQTPTLGTYTAASVARSSTTPFAPTAGPADPNANYVGISVTPTTLPGGGTVSVAANGTVTVTTTASTDFGTYPIRVSAVDTCGATETKQLTLTVAPTTPILSVASFALPTGNGLVQPNECNDVNFTVTNTGTVAATGVSGSLSTTTAGVTVTQAVAAFPDIPPGQSRTNLTPFQISSDAGTVCFNNVELDLALTFGGGGSPNFDTVEVPVGEDNSDNYVFQTTTGAVIPAGGVAVPPPGVGSLDDGISSLTAPFAFQLYGATVAAGAPLRATTNGLLHIGPSGTREYENSDLPVADSVTYAPETFPATLPTLFVYWNDLIMTQAGAGIFQQTVGTAPNRQWIIEWRAQEYSPAPTTVNTIFAVVFTEGVDGFEYLYTQTGGAEPNGTSSGIGIQATATGPNFTQFSNNTASVSAGTRLIASRPLPDCANGTGTCGNVDPTIFGDGFETP